MFEFTPSRRRRAFQQQRCIVSTTLSPEMIIHVDNLAESLCTTRSQLLAAAVIAGLPVLAAQAAQAAEADHRQAHS
jgi:predicted transcriptional regulator